jgi:hypothetical protein
MTFSQAPSKLPMPTALLNGIPKKKIIRCDRIWSSECKCRAANASVRYSLICSRHAMKRLSMTINGWTRYSPKDWSPSLGLLATTTSGVARKNWWLFLRAPDVAMIGNSPLMPFVHSQPEGTRPWSRKPRRSRRDCSPGVGNPESAGATICSVYGGYRRAGCDARIHGGDKIIA